MHRRRWPRPRFSGWRCSRPTPRPSSWRPWQPPLARGGRRCRTSRWRSPPFMSPTAWAFLPACSRSGSDGGALSERNRHSPNSHDSEEPVRIVDVVVALVVLVLLAPLLLLIAAAVAIDSGGSPFYRGWRAGKSGAHFRIWKFRTMVPDAEVIGPPITGHNDPRITPLGRFLRKTKLDELPQFVNVLIGDMTLVGPRPEAPEIVALYSEQQRAVLFVKPGVTGPGQLSSSAESEIIPAGDHA